MCSSSAQTSLRFNHLSLDEGLPQASVTAIIKDSQGFLWIGTQEGVIRYDGYTFKSFNPIEGTGLIISNDLINILFEDSQNNIWIGTNGGLNKFNTVKETFKSYRPNKHDLNSLSNSKITSIAEDENGNLWLGTDGGGLNKFNPIDEVFTRFRFDENDQSSISHDSVWAVIEDSSGDLWVGTESGLNKLNEDKKSFTRYRNILKSISHSSISVITEGEEGSLWIGTNGDGLVEFNIKNHTVINYLNDQDISTSLSNNFVRHILIDSQKDMWVGTRGGGLNLFNPVNKSFEHFKHDANDSNSLSDNNIHIILEDSQGNLWVGTNNGGVNRTISNSKKFKHLKSNRNDLNSLSNNNIRAMEVDSLNNIWVGTYGTGAGLNKFDIETGNFVHYGEEANNENSLSSDNVWAIAIDRFENLWIGTYGGGLNYFNPRTENFIHYRFDSNNNDGLSSDNVRTIYEDPHGNIWIGTYGGGLNLFLPESKTFKQFKYDEYSEDSLSNNDVRAIFQDSKQRFWVGTRGGGLNLFKPETETFKHYRFKTGAASTLSDDDISAIVEDSNGNLWVATHGGGINLFNPEQGVFTHYKKNNGLANNVVYRIEEDNEGYLWLSTNLGISRFDPLTKQFDNYDVNDGLQSNEFNTGASTKTNSGVLFFGGINGFNQFTPKDIIPDRLPPKVVFTEMTVLNKPVSTDMSEPSESIKKFVLNKAIHFTEQITLSHLDNIVSFEFAALHFNNPQKNKYAYQLVGLDKGWVHTNYKNRRATYTNLPSGEYSLRVKASNSDGYWNNEGTTLKITVLPPPWRTWWAYSIYTLFVFLLIGLFILSQRKKVHFERVLNQQLERKVAERTAELEKVSLTDQLTGAHNRRFLDKNIIKEVAQLNRMYFEAEKEEALPKLGFIMLDMDHFKQVNDVYGHDAGDKVLVQLVNIITDTCRQSDWIIRWGGEEFIVVAHSDDMHELQQLSERIRINIENHSFDIGKGGTINKTCSIGISSYPFIERQPEALSWEQTLNYADLALFAAKNNCRNSWVSLFEKHIINAEVVVESTQSVEFQIKESYLSYETSLQKEVNWK